MANWLKISISPQSIMRLLVTSYFIAASIGLIRRTGFAEFLTPLIAEDPAILIVNAAVLVLACLVLVGVQRRPAALILSLLLFYSSYVMLLAQGDVGAFWRDLALIGALLLASDMTGGAEENDISSDQTHDDLSSMVTKSPNTRKRAMTATAFREDLDIARTG